ncbi:MAG: T9SS type A sorting domain-containing protein [Flavobacteriales bacterium]|nr:T9SS type A sorting domain-containing protein [Flavobacteriales bacterium]
MTFRSCATALLISLISTASAQEHCLSHTITDRWLQQNGKHVDLAAEASALEQSNTRGGGLLTIPVAVHVVYNTASENVSNTVIQNIIGQLNLDYQALNADYNNVRPAFSASRANVGIEFCLASVDPNGNATDGITRTNSTETWFDPDTETDDMKSAPKGIAAWSPTQYLNIWICDITSGATGGLVTAGFAYLPYGGMVGSAIDGLVLDYNYGTGSGDRTATHEVGHYLGLDHPWGNDNCDPGDGISDTPPTNSPTFSCSNTSLMKCSALTQYENFMDYSNCTMMFTTGQANAMTGVLNGIRNGLLNSPGCGSSTPGGPCIPIATVGTGEGDFINSVILGGINNSNSGSTSGPTYHDYTSSYSTSLSQGGTYSISIQGGSYSPDHYAAWIDYNGDDSFSTSEKLGEFTTTAINQTQSISFTVPANTPVGATILRVRGIYFNTGEPDPADPCYDYAYGETEDYQVVITGGGGSYCIPTSANGTSGGDFVDGVLLGNIVNLGTGAADEPTYSDYTDLSTTLVRNNTYTVEVTSGSYNEDYIAVWIDFNGNHVFDTNEMVGSTLTSVPNQLAGFAFTVPSNAVLGTTRMRVRCMYPDLQAGQPNNPDPCVDFSWGETEDYSVAISTTSGIGEVIRGDLDLRTFTDHITVGWPTGSNDQQVLLTDASGRILLRQAAQGNSIAIGTNDLAAGVYQVIVTLDGKRYALRFIAGIK